MLQECLWCSCFIDRLWHQKKVASHYGKLICMGLIGHRISSFARSFILHEPVTVKCAGPEQPCHCCARGCCRSCVTNTATISAEILNEISEVRKFIFSLE